jgi:hypothetical protein
MATERRDVWANMPGPSVVTFGFDVLDRVEQAVAMVKERLKRRSLRASRTMPSSPAWLCALFTKRRRRHAGASQELIVQRARAGKSRSPCDGVDRVLTRRQFTLHAFDPQAHDFGNEGHAK